ncbi:hypothetical protein C9426_32690 [Serratia sp. S1B]|nr:hypothetical protein C9426_32690 [Serratia sp. S1B]
MLSFNLKFHLLSEWHIGSGREQGSYADSTTLKDSDGLPFIPGKSIKGLLRNAFEEALKNRWLPGATDVDIQRLFGCEGTQGMHTAGIIQLSSAELSERERKFLIEHCAKRLLYRTCSNTAIDQSTGVAKTMSLRVVETVVPMQLQARLVLNTSHRQWQPGYAEQFACWLQRAVMLVTELGAKRNRGLGAVQITVSPLTATTV